MHGEGAIAVPAAMCAPMVVIAHPFIKVLLQIFQIIVPLSAEGYGIKLLLHGAVQALADAIAL